MSNVNRPSKLTEWASSGVGIIEPSEGKKDTGWIVEAPPYQYFNWQASNAYSFEQYVDTLLGSLMSKGPYEGLTVDYSRVGSDDVLLVDSGSLLALDGERKYVSGGTILAVGTPNTTVGTYRVDYVVANPGASGETMTFELIEGTTPSSDQYVLATVWVAYSASYYRVGDLLNTCRFNEQGHRVVFKNSDLGNGNGLYFGNDALQQAIDICNACGGGVVEISGDVWDRGSDSILIEALIQNTRLKSNVIIDGLKNTAMSVRMGYPYKTETVTFTYGDDKCYDPSIADHRIVDGTPVSFTSTGTLPPELTALSGQEVYARDVDSGAGTYKLSLVPFGAVLNLTGNGTGTITRQSRFDSGFIVRGQYFDAVSGATLQNDNEVVCSSIDWSDYGIGSIVDLPGVTPDRVRVVSISSATTAVVSNLDGKNPGFSPQSGRQFTVYIANCGLKNIAVNHTYVSHPPLVDFGFTYNFQLRNVVYTTDNSAGDETVFYSMNSHNILPRITDCVVGGDITTALYIGKNPGSTVAWSQEFPAIDGCFFSSTIGSSEDLVVIGETGAESSTGWAGQYTRNTVEGNELIPNDMGFRDKGFLAEHDLQGGHTDVNVQCDLDVVGAATIGATCTISGDVGITSGNLILADAAKSLQVNSIRSKGTGGLSINQYDNGSNLTILADGVLAATMVGTTGQFTWESAATFEQGLTVTTGGLTAMAGGIEAASGNITATLGNIVATAGDIIATAGDITATDGDITSGKTGGIVSADNGVFEAVKTGSASYSIAIESSKTDKSVCLLTSVSDTAHIFVNDDSTSLPTGGSNGDLLICTASSAGTPNLYIWTGGGGGSWKAITHA